MMLRICGIVILLMFGCSLSPFSALAPLKRRFSCCPTAARVVMVRARVSVRASVSVRVLTCTLAERGKNILYEKQVHHLHELHRKKVEGMTSHLVKLGYSTKPKTIPKVGACFPAFLLSLHHRVGVDPVCVCFRPLALNAHHTHNRRSFAPT